MTAYDFEYTTTPELECMQACLREMLAWFHEWCKEHNLRYYVYGGTCLGAIRHSDIIPWDDDVDVAMPREDFNRMREIMIEEGICADEGVVSTDGVYPRYVLETPKSLSGDFIYGYGKLYDTTTTLIEHARTPIKRGVFLDIFSLDGMGNDFKEGCATMKRLLASRNLYLSTVAAKREGRAWYKNAAVLLGGVMGTIINRKKYLARLVSRCEEKPFDECAYVGQLFNLNGIKSVFAKEMFGIPQEHAFGSFVVNVPHDALGYLELEYGDWRRMPPVEKRVAKHDFIELSFGKSYLD